VFEFIGVADGTRTQMIGVRRGSAGFSTEGSTTLRAPSVPQKFPEKFPKPPRGGGIKRVTLPSAKQLVVLEAANGPR